jgi:phosphoserine phosphatase RsbU/P
MKPHRPTLAVFSAIIFVFDFLYLVARGAMAVNGAGSDLLHTLLLLLGYAAFTAAYLRRRPAEDANPMQLIARMVLVAMLLATGWGLFLLTGAVQFRAVGDALVPATKSGALLSIIAGIGAGIGAIVLFCTITELIFIKRRRGTKRNFVALLVALGVALLLHLLTMHDGASPLPRGMYFAWLFVLVPVMLVNAFRFAWVLVLSRREKFLNLGLSSLTFVLLVIVLAGTELVSGAAVYYHPLVGAFAYLVALFGCFYASMGFFSTLLHLPTAKEFDRKREEISSLQTMSRLITQVFDFDELLATAAQLAKAVCQGDGAWIELDGTATLSGNGDPHAATAHAATAHAATAQAATAHAATVRAAIDVPAGLPAALRTADGAPLQRLVLSSGKALIIADCLKDRRIHRESWSATPFGSCALFPLSAHGATIGVLGVVKKEPFGFDSDLHSAMAAFSDLVSVALENSRLIGESLRRERFEQELTVARNMQNSLLPSLFPLADTYDIAARSLPAYEVGGDYYDMVPVDATRVGIAVGDVSGKGISAALYMAQVKGIFQSLSPHFGAPREVLTRMNTTLCHTMDRRWFISLTFALLDTGTGLLRYARAGHCPLLYISRGSARFLRPAGMGLGLDASARFGDSIEVEEVSLQPGDVIVFFTDGVTEARNAVDDEFAEERLAAAVLERGSDTPAVMVDAVLDAVHRHAGSTDAADDRTVVVLRWLGPRSAASDDSIDTHARPEGDQG